MNRYLVLSFLFLYGFVAGAQIDDKGVVKDSMDTEKPSALMIVDVIEDLRKTTQLLTIAEKRVKPSSNIARVDSLLPSFKETILGEKKATATFLKANPNRQKVNNYLGKWRGHRAKLEGWKSTIVDRIRENAKVLDELSPYIERWNKVVNDSIYLKSPEEFINNVNKTTAELKQSFELIKNDIIAYLKIEAEVDNLLTYTNEATASLNNFKKSTTFDYSYRRHGFLWDEVDFGFGSDTSNVEQLVLKDELEQLENISSVNPDYLIKYILFVLIIVFFVRYLRRSYLKYPLTNKEGYLRHVEELFVKHHKVVIVFVCLLVLRILINDSQKIFIDITGIILLITALPIIRPYEDSFFRTLFSYVVVLVILDSLKTYTWFNSFEYRILLLVESIIAVGILYYYIRPYYLKQKVTNTGSLARTIIKISPVLLVLLVIAIISNLIGYTNLTDLCLKICILMGGVSIIFYASLLLSESIAISIINRHYSVNPGYSLTERKSIESKVLNFLKFIATFLWLMFFLKIIDQLSPIYDYLEVTLTEVYTVGSIEFTIGAIVSFFIVLIGSYILSSVVAFLINDGNGALKVFKLSKGVPAAISVIIRYIIIGFGFIFAISILGVDLSTFNLMAGALGLGIGFGLQTIISNFVSGLILIFERPILPGDSVEVNNLWGTVNKVGVRASVINTYDGAEVIVPNNNLITNDLINWTLSSKIRRMEVKVGTAYGSNPNHVLNILKEAAVNHPKVLKDPEPTVLFQGFGESSLNFTLWFWVYFENGLSSKSEISIDIYNRLDDANIEIPFPQRDVHIKSHSKEGKKPNSGIGFNTHSNTEE